MKNILFILLISMAVLSCTNSEKTITDNKIALRTDTINVVKLTDTLVIYESACRGCQYEASTNFSISDSNHITLLKDIITTDNNSPDMNGGNVSKKLILVPVKRGVTSIKLYKFLNHEGTAEDSARYTSYKIEVR